MFHERELTPTAIASALRSEVESITRIQYTIEEARAVHVEMDNAVRDAYGWSDLDLGHGFHEVDFLPENDRIRFTISPEARREVLRRLLALNHERHAAEVAGGGGTRGRSAKGEGAAPTRAPGLSASPQPAAPTRPQATTSTQPGELHLPFGSVPSTKTAPAIPQRAATKPTAPARANQQRIPETLAIEFVENDDVLPRIRQIVKEGGVWEREDLIREIARALGCERTGKNIRERVESAINAAVRRRILTREGPGAYTADCKTIQDYDRDTLTGALREVLGNAWWPRETAIANAARYLGFQRAGKNIVVVFKSIINGAIRRGLIEADGGEIRRMKGEG